jgi:NAD(P)-dependent dehydrogenase (short-subunit alcohol dehydrogenase family)
MNYDFKGKVVIVTGGSKGIGRSIASHLACQGADVVTCSRNVKGGHLTSKDNRKACKSIISIRGDGTKKDDVQKIVDFTIEKFGKLDILVNNIGGANSFGGFLELSLGDYRKTFELNVITMINFTRFCYPYLKASNCPRIITISSLTGLQPGNYNPHYSIAKAATINLSKHLANIFAEDRITVNVICPGPVHSSAWEKNISYISEIRSISLNEAKKQIEREESAKIPLKRIGEGADIAGLVSYLASEEASWITGSCFIIDGGKHCSIF